MILVIKNRNGPLVSIINLMCNFRIWKPISTKNRVVPVDWMLFDFLDSGMGWYSGRMTQEKLNRRYPTGLWWHEAEEVFKVTSNR